MEKVIAKINQLHAELITNNGVMPQSWEPFAEVIIILLDIAKQFTDYKTYLIIDEIIEAIKAEE